MSDHNQTPKSNVRFLPSSQNPFKAGSRKARCYEIFRAGGERAAMIEAMTRTGIAPSSARTFIHLFNVYTAGLTTGAKKGGTQ